MVVYAVAAEVSIIKVFAGFIPGFILTALFSGYIIVGRSPTWRRRRARTREELSQKLAKTRLLMPCPPSSPSWWW
jgi:TRAP-type C4-dicarboxylate transport system permease large subunit